MDAVTTLVNSRQEFLTYLERRVSSRAAAEDILQEAFARGLDKIDQLQDGESAVGWFYRVLRNAVIDHYRRNAAASRGLQAFAEEIAQNAAPTHDTRAALCKCVARVTEGLKPEYAEVLRRVEVDGVAVKDYAVESDITPGNAAVRVFRAREALRKQVAHTCGRCAEHGCVDCTCGGPKS